MAVNFQPQHVWKPPGRSSRICYQFSLHATSLSKHVAMCTALVCGAQCSMPARLGHLQSQTSSVCSEMTGQWSDRSTMSGHKTLSPPGPMSYLRGLALRIWTSFWRREDSDGMDMWNAPMVQSRQPLTYRSMESVGLGGPRWHGSSWQRGIAESGSSRLSTLMIDIPGDLVWDLPCMQQASYLEGGPLMWMLPLYLHVNQKSDYHMMIWWHSKFFSFFFRENKILHYVKHLLCRWFMWNVKPYFLWKKIKMSAACVISVLNHLILSLGKDGGELKQLYQSCKHPLTF